MTTNFNRISIGQVGVAPGDIRLLTSENLATITAAGFADPYNSIINFSPSDVVTAMYGFDGNSGTLTTLTVSISNGVITLVQDDIPNNSIGTDQLQDSCVTEEKIAALAVSEEKLALMSVTTSILDDDAVDDTKLADNAVTTNKILDNAVTLAKLASGISPAYIVKYAGNKTTVGGSATESFTVSGIAATDLVFVVMKTQGAGTRTILEVPAPTTNTFSVVFSGDPGNDHVITYQVLRAAA